MIYRDTKQNGTKYAYRSISKLTLQAFRTVKRRSYSLEWWLSIQPPIPNPLKHSNPDSDTIITDSF